jgi:signal transduction histidine kinase
VASGTAFVRIPKLLRTSSFRITTAYAALFSLSALILFILVYSGTSQYMRAELNTAIASDLTELDEIFKTQGTNSLVREIQTRMRQADNADMVYMLQDPQGVVMAGNMPPQPLSIGPSKFEVPVYTPDGKERTVHAHGIVLPDGQHLTVGVDTSSLHEMRSVILRAFAFSFGITLLLAFFGGAMMSRNLLLHVERISQTGREIMGGNLSLRIPLRGVDDEFDHLATSLNLMLDQTERLVESIRQVSNDIAHDLRTPLTRMRQRLERTQRSEQSVERLRTAIDRSIVDADGILETFGALLRIAQIESATSRKEITQVDLSEALQTVVEIHQPTADEKRQHLKARIAPNLRVLGDRELITQMVSNLLENAIRHSPERASISLTGSNGAGGVEVVIADTGPGIPETERGKVFRRFYRLESSRSTPGSGLGLSLVAAVAERHNATVQLDDNNPGLRVRLRFSNSHG